MDNYKRLIIYNIDKILTIKNQHYIVKDIIKNENKYILNINPTMNVLNTLQRRESRNRNTTPQILFKSIMYIKVMICQKKNIRCK